MTEVQCCPLKCVVVLGENAQRAYEISAGLSARGWSPTVLDLQDGMCPSTPSGCTVVLQVSSLNPDTVGAVVRLREEGKAVCVVVSDRQPSDGTVFLQIGAADYIAEPVDLREIELRLRIIAKINNKKYSRPLVRLESAGIDFVGRSVLRGDGKRNRLTETECRLLRAFIERKGPLSREEILSMVSGTKGSVAKSRVADVLISALRRKLDDDGAPSCIISLRGRGYMFRRPG